jgi:transcriptional regulator with XRE-family HTH domain
MTMKSSSAVARGKKFQEARERLHLTQQEVADKVDLNVSHYAKIERGEIPKTAYENIENIRKALKLKPNDL